MNVIWRIRENEKATIEAVRAAIDSKQLPAFITHYHVFFVQDDDSYALKIAFAYILPKTPSLSNTEESSNLLHKFRLDVEPVIYSIYTDGNIYIDFWNAWGENDRRWSELTNQT